MSTTISRPRAGSRAFTLRVLVVRRGRLIAIVLGFGIGALFLTSGIRAF
jgi:hypothetical protein